MKKKTLALVLALTLLVAGVVGGTLAWLTATTSEVTNTFTVGDIELKLEETKNLDKDGKWTAQIIPGYSYEKDPKVTINAGVESYLFVEVTASANLSDYVTYTSTLTEANGWTQGTGDAGDGVPTNVWYRTVPGDNADHSWYLIDNNTVTISSTLDNEALTNATEMTLTYKAYAIQKSNGNNSNFTAAAAWTEVSK